MLFKWGIVVHLAFNLSLALHWLLSPCQSYRRWWTSGWTATSTAKRRGCWFSSTSLLEPADAKVRVQVREPTRWGVGVKVEEIIFPISAEAMINSQLLISQYGNNVVSRLRVMSIDNTPYRDLRRVEWQKWQHLFQILRPNRRNSKYCYIYLCLCFFFHFNF